MSMCRIFSCIFGRGCLLWPGRSLGKTLLAFDLLHFVLQGQTLVTPGISWLPTFAFQSPCKTQNSGLRSKEEKPCDPINQPSRCNTQEGLLSFAQTGDSDLLGGRAHRTANWASFICSMLHTGYKVIGHTFAKQSYWYELRGLLFKFKAILLVQMARAFVQT